MIKKVITCGILCILILVSGCSGVQKTFEPVGYDKVPAESSLGRGEMAVPSPPQEMPAPFQAKTDTPVSGQKESSEDSEQKIIRTASLSLEVSDVKDTAEEIERVAAENKGLIQSSSIYGGQNNQYSGSITIRVPSERFDDLITRINQEGKVISYSTSAQDVTEEYIDLNAQKRALTTQLEQYNRILTQAVNVSEILEVQREIERVQVDLDRIVGRMKYLENRISFSTVTITLSEPAQVITSSGQSVASVINEGISGFIEMITFLIIFVMTILPLIIIGTVVYLMYRQWNKKKQR